MLQAPADPKAFLAERAVRFQNFLNQAKGLTPVVTAVCHPCDAVSLSGALMARRDGLIEPILVGPESRIRAVAEQENLSLEGVEILNTEHSLESAEKAVALVRQGRAEAIMKGSLHTDELMAEVVSRDHGLRTAHRISHAMWAQVPTYDRPLLITDAGINIAPDLNAKVDIVQNVIDLAHLLGNPEPKVAILSAVETVTSAIPSTLEAAALCKMADRGQIKGAILDGPLAFDNAISLAAAQTKGIKSSVAGNADILVVPDLESGNMLVKQLEYFANALMAGVVLGARVPIILTSRADSAETRTASCVLAVLMVHARKKMGVKS